MQEELNISLQAWGWVVGVFAIAYGAFEIPSGSLGDRIGARRVLTRIVCWWSAFTCLTGTVSNYYSLLLTRFCFGMGEAGAYPTTATSISRWFPQAERGGAFGIVWMASQAGAALSPLLVVPIQMRYGWRTSFFLFGLIGMGWCAVWYLWYRDNPGDKPAITRQELDEIGIAPMPHGDRLPWGGLFRDGNLWALMTLALTYCYGMYFFISWLPTYLAKGRGFGESELLLSTVPFVLGALANGCRRICERPDGEEAGIEVGPACDGYGESVRRSSFHVGGCIHTQQPVGPGAAGIELRGHCLPATGRLGGLPGRRRKARGNSLGLHEYGRAARFIPSLDLIWLPGSTLRWFQSAADCRGVSPRPGRSALAENRSHPLHRAPTIRHRMQCSQDLSHGSSQSRAPSGTFPAQKRGLSQNSGPGLLFRLQQAGAMEMTQAGHRADLNADLSSVRVHPCYPGP